MKKRIRARQRRISLFCKGGNTILADKMMGGWEASEESGGLQVRGWLRILSGRLDESKAVPTFIGTALQDAVALIQAPLGIQRFAII